MNEDIATLFSNNKNNVHWRYTGPFDKTKQIVRADNLLHLAARIRDTDAFLSVSKKSVESDVHLLEYNDDRENPFHIAAKMGMLPDVVRGMFKHLESEETNPKYDLKKLENVKGYIRKALRNKSKNVTSIDWMINEEDKKKVREIAGMKDSFICNKKFHLCLYIVGAIACIAALCLSLYFLYLSSEAFALSSIASMAFGGVTYLSYKAFSEIHDLHNAEISQFSEERAPV